MTNTTQKQMKHSSKNNMSANSIICKLSEIIHSYCSQADCNINEIGLSCKNTTKASSIEFSISLSDSIPL